MLSFPNRARLQTYIFLALLLSVLFVVVYGTTNHHGSQVAQPYRLWLPFELSIPLIPEFIFIYMSLNLMTFLPLFVLSAPQLKALGWSMALTILLAGIFFYFVPAPLGYVRPDEVARYNSLFQLLYQLDNVANTFPSLHITLSFLSARSMTFVQKRLNFLWLWFFLICLSVIFTHQHHLIDIAGGMILGELGFRKVFLRFHGK